MVHKSSILKIFAFVAFLACAFSANSATQALRGDVNNDGSVTINDVTVLIDYLLIGNDSMINLANADCDQNGEVSISDVSALIDYLLIDKWPDEPEIQTFTVNGVSFQMVAVDGGTFMMGASDDAAEAYDNEKPAHKVTLSSYSIGKTEVTQALWIAVMGNNPSNFPDDTSCPVEMVSWNDCQTFINTLNQMTGKSFRLPTEAEWEFAARGGNKSHGYTYAGSNNINEVAWFYSTVTCTHTFPVASKAPNELGLYDMSGNVSEWCQDYYGNYSANEQTNPTGPVSGSYRVYRGGGWSGTTTACRVTFRSYGSQANKYYYNGLRLVL